MNGSIKTALVAAVVSALVAAGGSGLNATMLQLTNTSTGASATALGLTTPSSRPPMIVSSGAKVANLNADKLDGQDSSSFVPAAVVRRVGPVTMPATTTTSFKTLTVIGQVTFMLACTDVAGIEIAGLWIQSSVDHAAYGAISEGSSTPFQSSNPNMVANTKYGIGGGVQAPSFSSVTGQARTANGQQVTFELYVGQDVGTTTDHTCIGGGTFIVK